MIQKNIIGFEKYKVTDRGDIIGTNNKILSKSKNNDGYYYVTLCKDGKNKRKTIHRLVAIHFVENTHNKPIVNHKDGNKKNNHWTNLEWCTQKENMQHAKNVLGIDFGKGKEKVIGELNGRSKLNKIQVDMIKCLNKNGFSRKDISESFNISRSHVRKIILGIKWNKSSEV